MLAMRKNKTLTFSAYKKMHAKILELKKKHSCPWPIDANPRPFYNQFMGISKNEQFEETELTMTCAQRMSAFQKAAMAGKKAGPKVFTFAMYKKMHAKVLAFNKAHKCGWTIDANPRPFYNQFMGISKNEQFEETELAMTCAQRMQAFQMAAMAGKKQGPKVFTFAVFKKMHAKVLAFKKANKCAWTIDANPRPFYNQFMGISKN
jgi:hypothetical protein